MKLRRFRAFALVLAIALFAAACGDDSDGTEDSGAPPETSGGGSTEQPQSGGTLSVGIFSFPPSFDPATFIGSNAAVGGAELTALYDTLMSFEPETGTYTPRVAESLEPNADHTVWTLTLRSGVKFTDGTDYDAEAVKFNIERHIAPDSRSLAKPVLARFLDTVKVVDPLTVEFTLKEAWAGFPTILAREAGMIASPAAIEAAGENFATNPGKAGAGPFMLTSFKPGEAIEMTKNPDYYGGEVLLDGLRFVTYGDENANLQALRAGDLQAVYVRSPKAIAAAKDAGVESVLLGATPMGYGLVINSGVELTCTGEQPAPACTGKADGTKVTASSPTSDPRVRRAIAAAIDPEVVNDRAYDGTANATTEAFPAPLSWSPGVDGPKHDPAEARKLVEQAKADGWDGTLRLIVPSNEADFGLAVATQLEAVGINVQLDSSGDVSAVTQAVSARRDFDLAGWSIGFTDDINATYLQLTKVIDPARFGYQSEKFAAGMDALRVASTDEARKAAMKTIAEVITEDVPYLSLYLGEQRLLVSDAVRGVVADAEGRAHYATAWLAR